MGGKMESSTDNSISVLQRRDDFHPVNLTNKTWQKNVWICLNPASIKVLFKYLKDDYPELYSALLLSALEELPR